MLQTISDMKKIITSSSLLLVIILCVWGCQKEDVGQLQERTLQLPDTPFNYSNQNIPTHFKQELQGSHEDIDHESTTGEANLKISDHGATLGRVLFYDPQLSLNNRIACASCHHQANGFADPTAFSEGFKTVTQELIGEAMSQFLRSMLSFDSPFDRGLQDGFVNFTTKEQLGRDLFFSDRLKCGSCHSGANFSAPNNANSFGGIFSDPMFNNNFENNEFNNSYRETRGTTNIGLDIDYADEGMGRGQFRIPSLRNIALTAPYMHDGRFATLEEVIDHYDRNIQPHTNLDSKFKNENGLPQQLGLSSIEKEALIAFLHTLTDEAFILDEKFSNPFN